MSDQKNLILAVAISLLILIAFDVFYNQPRMQAQKEAMLEQQARQEQAIATGATGRDGGIPDAPGGVQGGAPIAESAPNLEPRDRKEILAENPRIRIEGDRVHGSLSLKGARLDDLTLADYYETTDGKDEVVLLSPSGSRASYFAEFGWVQAAGPKQPLPGASTIWQSNDTELRSGGHITQTWDNGNGLIFEKTIALDENYMFTVTQKVTNTTGEEVVLHPYGLVRREGDPEVLNFFILHEGAVGVLDGTLEDIEFKKLAEGERGEYTSTGGWLGMTDKYWLVSLAPDQQESIDARYLFQDGTATREKSFQTDYRGQSRRIAPGQSASFTSHLFAGAKEVDLLDSYEKQIGLPHFDKAVDFGMFYFMTKPFFYALDFLGGLIGNFGLAIIAFTVILRALMFPFANKSYKELGRMKELQPQMQALQERHGEDKEKLQQEMMALYQREKVNPVGGCLPMLIQIPVFFALYKVLFVTIEMRHAPFFGWIQDLSAPDPTTVFNLFGLIPWDPPSLLHVGAWPLLMGLSMFLQQKMNPSPPDKTQAQIMMFLPVIFTFMLAKFPAGLVIYWATSNLLAIAQQWIMMKRHGKKKTA